MTRIRPADPSNMSQSDLSESEAENIPNYRNRPRKSSQSPDLLLTKLCDSLHILWQQIKSASTFVMEDMGGNQLFDRMAQWSKRNPFISIFLLAASITMLLPLLIIFALGIATFVMTVTGFIVLEGTLLTFISILLFGCLGAIAIVMILFALVGVAVFFGLTHIYGLFGGAEKFKIALINFLQNDITSRPTASAFRLIVGDAQNNHETLIGENISK